MAMITRNDDDNDDDDVDFQSKAGHPRIGYINELFCSCDLELDLMTLIYELDLDILKMYPHTKNEQKERSR